MRSSPAKRACFFTLFCAVFAAFPLAAQAVIKLYLKDGTYQLVKEYKVERDRVSYYSVERSRWEDVPLALVDFDKTRQTEAQEKDQEKKEVEEAKKTENQRFEDVVTSGWEVAPGIHLPGDDGAFAFDGARVIRLVQSPAEVVRDKKRMALLIALPGPLVKARSLVVLQGPRATIRVSSLEPTFYVQSAENAGARVALVSLKQGKNSRLVEKVQGGIGVGQSGELREAIPLERKQVAPGIYQLKSPSGLPIGEYALGELEGDKLNLDVWDFGVDGAAPKSPGGETPPIIRKLPAPPRN
jgi:hypothetical protein